MNSVINPPAIISNQPVDATAEVVHVRNGNIYHAGEVVDRLPSNEDAVRVLSRFGYVVVGSFEHEDGKVITLSSI